MRALVLFLVLLALAPSALAADGRVLVATGPVMLERAAPGAFSITAIRTGHEIRRGDLIRTGSDGRAQIRFSDGAIVSLQPGTEFRVDEYRFEQNERRAFFSLLRGALRTVTGAIGKTDHDEYRMKTPTATVGVRGTEYVAEQTVCDPRCAPGPREGLRVAVTRGRIVLATTAGEIEIGEGEAAAAEASDSAPQRSERGPVLPPISAAAQSSERASRTPGAAGSTTGANASAGAASAEDGTASADAGSAGIGTNGDPAGSASAGAEPAGRSAAAPSADTGATGAGVSKTAPGWIGSVESGSGESGSGESGSAVDPAAPPTKNQGAAPVPRPPGSGATAPAGGDRSDGVDPAVDAWPRFVTTRAPEAGSAVSPNEQRDAQGSLRPALFPAGSSAAPVPGTPGTGETGTDPGPDPLAPGTGGADPRDPGGPGAGSSDPHGPTGPGAEGSDPKDPVGGGEGDAGPRLAVGPQPIAGPAAAGTGVALHVLAPRLWETIGTRASGGSLELDEAMRLQSFDARCLTILSCRASRGSATVEDDGHDEWVSWGRWTGGSLRLGLPVFRIGADEGLHYLVGVPTATLPTSGMFGYELIGATHATLSNGSAARGSLEGRAAVLFSAAGARIGVDAHVAIADGSYQFATPGGAVDPALSTIVTDTGAFSGNVGVIAGDAGPLDCARGCSARLDGGLFGPDAARLGVTYRITGPGAGTTISGVGVFEKKTLQE